MSLASCFPETALAKDGVQETFRAPAAVFQVLLANLPDMGEENSTLWSDLATLLQRAFAKKAGLEANAVDVVFSHSGREGSERRLLNLAVDVALKFCREADAAVALEFVAVEGIADSLVEDDAYAPFAGLNLSSRGSRLSSLEIQCDVRRAIPPGVSVLSSQALSQIPPKPMLPCRIPF